MDGRQRGITLVELILVLAVLALVLGVSAPSLSLFFRSRALDEEARRFVALTRFASSQAVSRGIPMELWVEPDGPAYGLAAQAGYLLQEAPPSVEYRLPEGAVFEIDATAVGDDGRGRIRFLPAGTVEADSLETVAMLRSDDDRLEIRRKPNGRDYALWTDPQADAAGGDRP